MTSTNAALCATLLPVVGDLWFSTDAADRAEAKAHCRRCPLQLPCREAGLADLDAQGVWGGLSAQDRGRARRRERVRVRQARSRARRLLRLDGEHAKGGTAAGGALHRRLGEPVCELCRRAEVAAQRARNAAARPSPGLTVVPGSPGGSESERGSQAGTGAAA